MRVIVRGGNGGGGCEGGVWMELRSSVEVLVRVVWVLLVEVVG